MPFCTNCGASVKDTDIFCGGCGARQRVDEPRTAGAAQPEFLNKVSNRNAAIFCYIPIVGWIAAIIVLASARFRMDRTVRFHAFQGLYLFVAYLLVEWVVSPMMHFTPGWGPQRVVSGMLELTVWIAWIFMLVKTSQSEMYRLPIIGELAERSLAEQI